MDESKLIFTIGRTNGSGGREIAAILAKRLGIVSYDTELINETAKMAGISVEDVYKQEEKEGKGAISFYGIPASNPLHQYQFEAIAGWRTRGNPASSWEGARIMSSREDRM